MFKEIIVYTHLEAIITLRGLPEPIDSPFNASNALAASEVFENFM